MKTFVVLMSVLAFADILGQTGATHPKCTVDSPLSSEEDPKWIDLKESCFASATEQIRMEFGAALAYLQIGAHFSQYDVNRPGFAKFFLAASSEERQHGIKLYDYLLMRGKLPTPDLHSLISPNSVSSTQPSKNPKKSTPVNKLISTLKSLGEDLNKNTAGLWALERALELEVDVTRSIKKMIRICEDEDNLSKAENITQNFASNDYHMSDWLITDLLDEQLKGQRELAGRISTLQKMKGSYGEIADFLYDKTLLEDLEKAI